MSNTGPTGSQGPPGPIGPTEAELKNDFMKRNTRHFQLMFSGFLAQFIADGAHWPYANFMANMLTEREARNAFRTYKMLR